MWEENLRTSCIPHTTEILDPFPSTLTRSWNQRNMCASEKDVANFVLLLHKACVTLFLQFLQEKKTKPHKDMCSRMPRVLQQKRHQALICSGDKGVQFIHHPPLLCPKRHEKHTKNPLKEKLFRISILSLLSPCTFHPHGFQCYH